MRVLVTGGAGFIGANLVRHLAGRGHDCVVLDDLSTGAEVYLTGGPRVELVRGSVLDAAVLTGLVEGTQAVVHLAGITGVPLSLRDPRRTHDVNVNGTINVLEAARAAGGRHVLFASSAAVYGQDPSQPQHEDLPVAPTTPYAASKLAAEQYVLAYADSFGLDVLALRFFNIYGPLQVPGHGYAAVIPAFLDAALRGDPLQVHGDGEQTRDMTFVGTVVDVLTTAIEGCVTAPTPVNLASGQRHSVTELVAALASLLGGPLQVERHDARLGDVRHSSADLTRLRELFPDLQPTDLHEGLRQTLAWYRGAATTPST